MAVTSTGSPRGRSAATPRTGARPSDGPGVPSWVAWLESPLAPYYLVLGATVALVVLGLVMVLSSSSVESFRLTQSSFTVFSRQAMFAAVGLPLAVLATRVPVRAWKALAWPLLVVALAGLVLVFAIGKEVNGNRNWIVIGGLTLQPSEAAKLALVVWTATVLASKQALLTRTAHILVPVVPVAGFMLLLVLLGHDLGTALVIMLLVGVLLFVGGAPFGFFAAGGGLMLAVAVMLASGRSSRQARVQNWLDGSCGDLANIHGPCWQAVHGKWALASGGWWGVGLGASREKWSWLPEAHNDFIFAVIGEELGLTGSLVVLALFAVLAVGLYRIVVTSDDLFVKVATAGVMAWILGQATVNIGAVLGMLPIIGLPLPLVSSGGSALLTTMVALGMVIGFARRAPGAPEALAARSGLVRRSLAVLPARREGGGR